MSLTLKMITRRLMPDRTLLEIRPQIGATVLTHVGASVLTQIRLHSSLHRLLDQEIRCNILKKSFE